MTGRAAFSPFLHGRGIARNRPALSNPCMSRRAHLLLTLALGIAAAGAHAETANGRPTSVATLLQSDENLAFLRSPERVEICVLTAKEPLFRKKSGRRRYVEGPSQRVPAAAADRLRARLAADETYRWHTIAEGEPTWNVRVKFFRGDHYLSADFCFDSALVLFARDGLPFSAEDYIDSEHEFFALARARFPKDKSLGLVAARLEARARELAERNAGFEQRSAASGP